VRIIAYLFLFGNHLIEKSCACNDKVFTSLNDRLVGNAHGYFRTHCGDIRFCPAPPGNAFAPENTVFGSRNESSGPNGVEITACVRYELSAATRR